MGQTFSECFDNSPEGAQNREVTKNLDEWNNNDNQVIKILLLGAGGSGKSTVFKQMKVIHQNGYAQEELDKYKDVIRRNVMEIFKLLIAYAENNLGLEETDIVKHMKETNYNTFQLSPDLVDPLQKLFKSDLIQEAYKNRGKFDLMDNVEYFVKELPRFCDPKFAPTTEDVLRSRVKTIGITENSFTIANRKFKMVDVGGQRNERRKWIHAFDAVTCVIFVVALSEYDQVLAEVDDMNRMKESFKLFDDICNQRYFKEKPLIIFFNKSDIFEQKIKQVDINVCELFAEYKGGLNMEAAQKFIVEKFRQLGESGVVKPDREGQQPAAYTAKKKRQIAHHVTNATDTKAIQIVFDSVKGFILNKILEDNRMIS